MNAYSNERGIFGNAVITESRRAGGS